MVRKRGESGDRKGLCPSAGDLAVVIMTAAIGMTQFGTLLGQMLGCPLSLAFLVPFQEGRCG